MRWRDGRWSGWAVWLGVLALVLNALVPVHLAFDLAEALEPGHHAHADAAPLERELVAVLCGHQEGGDRDHHDGKHGGHGCPVCTVVGTLAALAVPTGATLPPPTATAARLDRAAILTGSHPVPAAAYRSRAPPLA